jgi:hypothetical protein
MHFELMDKKFVMCFINGPNIRKIAEFYVLQIGAETIIFGTNAFMHLPNLHNVTALFLQHS